MQTCEYARKSSIFQDNQLIFDKNDKYFTPEHRRKLVSILNMKIMYREKKMYMCNMIENYIEQYASLIMKRTDNIVFPDVYNLIGEEYGQI